MSELDDAIREHLELKRRHGADDEEVRQLEDEAFGTGERPVDPFHAADDLLKGGEAGVQPGAEGVPPSSPPEEGTPADVPQPETPLPASGVESPAPGGLFDADAPSTELPAPAPADDPAAPDSSDEAATDGPADQDSDSDVPDSDEPAPPPVEPSAAGSPIPPPPPPRADRASEVVHMPTEEYHPPDPASEELSVDAEFAEFEDQVSPPADAEPAAVTEAPPEAAPPEADADPGLYDFEADAPAESASAPPPATPDDLGGLGADDEDAFADLGPADEEPNPGPEAAGDVPPSDDDDEGEDDDPGPGAVTADTSEREALEATQQYRVPEPKPSEPEPTPPAEEPDPTVERPQPPPAAADEPEDLLEETPEFLESAETAEGEDEGLWFEQRPPKDFDFDE